MRRSAYLGVACTIVGSIGFSGKPVIIKMAYAYGGLAHVFLGEPVTWVQLAGAVLVLAGVVIMSFRPQSARA